MIKEPSTYLRIPSESYFKEDSSSLVFVKRTTSLFERPFSYFKFGFSLKNLTQQHIMKINIRNTTATPMPTISLHVALMLP